MRYGFFLAAGLAAGLLWASPAAATTTETTGAELQVFVRESCPHCADAKQFLAGFAAERPWLRITYRPVDQDPRARDELLRVSAAAGVWPPGVPTFVIDGRVLVGFDTAARSGPAIASLVDEARPPGEDVDAGPLGTLSASRLGLPLFTLALGLLDGFNPCAMWVLLFLLSLLVHLRDRRRMAFVAGTFVVASGAVYYAFMAAWLNVFLMVGMTAALRWVLGALALAIGAINVKEFFVESGPFTLSIPAGAKPGLYARMRAVLRAETLLPSLLGVAVLAVVVNFVELLCTAGFPAIYTAVLSQQSLTAAGYYGYLGLYILGYVADDALMVAVAVTALGGRRLTARAGRWLKLVSGAVMALLGVLLLARPDLLM